MIVFNQLSFFLSTVAQQLQRHSTDENIYVMTSVTHRIFFKVWASDIKAAFHTGDVEFVGRNDTTGLHYGKCRIPPYVSLVSGVNLLKVN